MSITITGTVVDEAGTGIDDLTVEARGDWLLTTERLDLATTRDGGSFSLVLEGVVGEATHPVSCRVRVVDGVGRPISDDTEVPGTAGNQAIGRIVVRDKDRSGLLVTNLRGDARFVSTDNAVTMLIDGEEAFGRVSRDIGGDPTAGIQDAKKSIYLTQLFFGVPDFAPTPAKEHPELVFDFGLPPIVPLDPLPAGQTPDPVPRPKDRRPERLLLDAAARKVAVRVLLNEPRLSWPEGVFWLAEPARPAGQWNDYEIRVEDDTFTVLLNGSQVNRFVNTDPNHGQPVHPHFVGLQIHFASRMAFRDVQFKAL